jgi:hypothetical protein
MRSLTVASVVVERSIAERGDLPRVCATCGEKAALQVETSFYRRAQLTWWIPLPSYVKSLPLPCVTVKLPLCNAHKAMWFWDRVQMLVLCGVVFTGLVLGQQSYRETMQFSGDDAGPIPRLLYFGGFALMIGPLILLRTTYIRAGMITDTHVTLKGVAKEFANAIASRTTAETSCG